METLYTFFATAPRGIEQMLADELRGLGAAQVKDTRAGVSFAGPLEIGYRACLWSRLASRVLMPLAHFEAADPEALYAGVDAIDWSLHLEPEGTLAVDANVAASGINHSQFAALKVKDAIVDQFRQRCGVRPGIDLERPNIRVNLYLYKDQATLSLDLSGESLHRRGYREEARLAPMKENLAAAILVRAGWPDVAAAGGTLVDPMCGSGTLPLEAALMAGDVAPGLLREYFGFLGWRGHDEALWQRLRAEAFKRREAGLSKIPVIIGFDAAPGAVHAALTNAKNAGLQDRVHFEKRELAAMAPPAGKQVRTGLVIANPPYGERLGDVNELHPVYACLGEGLKAHFAGWQAAVFTGNPELGRNLGLRARKTHPFFNGALECKLLRFEIDPRYYYGADAEAHQVRIEDEPLSPGAEMFANRLRKNLKTLGRWARKEGVSCYRVFDADMPEYAVAVDIYEDWVHVSEYEAPKTIDPTQAGIRFRDVLTALPQVLQVPRDRIFSKVRRRQKGSAQYRKLSESGNFHTVSEGNCRFLVNFTDYLDTGLFLDHRLTRHMIQNMAADKRFLNLFAYTGTATVHAAMGGARSTTTVDMSKTYLGWAQKNLALNGFSGRAHEFIQADCLKWIKAESRTFDLIFLDPPTFSNSKSMTASFDVQRDHVALLGAASRLLAPGGVLVFSNNNRRFRMEREALPDLDIEEITAQTIPQDFARNPRIHNCLKITRRK